jgi:hypothetical protein
MKKLLYSIIILSLLPAACGDEFSGMSTASLLENEVLGKVNTLMEDLWCLTCSNYYIPGVTRFNEKLRERETVVELFKRSDCFSVVEAKYQAIIQEKKEITGYLDSTTYFEMLLASELCMSALNKSEKVRLLELALEKAAYETVYANETCHIMIAVMQSCNYVPFMEEVRPQLHESMFGYTLCAPDESIIGYGLEPKGGYDLIISNAKQLLNEQ